MQLERDVKYVVACSGIPHFQISAKHEFGLRKLYYYEGNYYTSACDSEGDYSTPSFDGCKLEYFKLKWGGGTSDLVVTDDGRTHIIDCAAILLSTEKHFNGEKLNLNPKRFAVSVMCINPISGQVLGTTRKNKSDDWGFVGGSIDPGETSLTAAMREFHEETGIQLLVPPSFVGRFKGTDDNWEVDMYVTAPSDNLAMTRHFSDIPREVEEGILVGYVDYFKLCMGSFGAFNIEFLNTYMSRSRITPNF